MMTKAACRYHLLVVLKGKEHAGLGADLCCVLLQSGLRFTASTLYSFTSSQQTVQKSDV